MRAGRLRQVIRVERAVTTTDATTNESRVTSWAKHCEAFAEVTDKRGREFYENGQFYSRTLTQFRCRFFDLVGVTEQMRVVYDTRAYRILGIRQDHHRMQETYLDTELVT